MEKAACSERNEIDTIDYSMGDCQQDEIKSCQIEFSHDVPDSLPKKLTFTFKDVVLLMGSIVFFVIDTCSDLFVSYCHYKNGDIWYFSLTLTFIVLPRIVMTSFNLWWYIADKDNPNIMPTPRFLWILRIVLLLLQLGPALRHVDSLVFGILSRRSKDPKLRISYYQQMIYEDADAALLKLFGAFLEAAPQLILQFYILVVNEPKEELLTVPLQWVSVVFSLFSLSWAITNNQRAQRYQLADKKNLTWYGSCVQFIWFAFLISSRLLALGLFASQFPAYFGIVCALHWLVMFLWIYYMKTAFCETKWGEVVYNMVLGAVYIFCYINPIDTRTRYRWLLYYIFIFVQNTILITVWFLSTGVLWYKWAAMIGCFFTFAISLVMMVIYYLLLHPTGNITIRIHHRSKANTSLNGESCKVEETDIKENVRD